MHKASIATQALDDIKSGLANRFEHVRNLKMTYVATETMVNGDPPRDIQNQPFNRDLKTTEFLGDKKLGFPWVVAEHRLHENKRYVHLIMTQLGAFNKVPPIPKPGDSYVVGADTKTLLRHQIHAWDGNVQTQLSPGGVATISEDISPLVLDNLVFDYLDYPVIEEQVLPADNLFLPKSIDAPQVRLLPQLDEISGHVCHVIELPDRDRLWVDVVRGYAIIKRETRFSDAGPLRRILTTQDWQDVGSGVWLPQRITTDFYCSPLRHPDRKGQVSSRVEINASYTVEPLDQEKFRLSFPRGGSRG